jgi:hypothetical protein
MIHEYGAVVGVNDNKTKEVRKETVPMPLCPPPTTQELPWPPREKLMTA